MALSKIKTNSLSDDAVTAAKIATGTIVAADLAANSVDSSELVDGGVDLSHMSVNSIDSDQYVDGSIDLAHMSVNSIDSDQYVDGSIDNAHIADDAIDSEHYADGSIDTAHIANDQITAALIADNAIDSDMYVDGSIDLAHMSVNSIDSDQYVDGSIDLVHMSVNSIDSDQYVDGSIDLAHMSVNSIDSDQYVDASIDTAHIGNLQITTALIAADAITAAKIADDAIDSEHYTDGSIDLAHMSSESVDEDNLHISNAGSNGQFLSKQSGNSGGLTWAAAGGTITALNNATANELVTIGATTTELDAEANLMFDGSTLSIAGAMYTSAGSTTPGMVIRKGGYQDNLALLVGANINSTSVSQDSRKMGIIAVPHFASETEEPYCMMRIDGDDASSTMQIGGTTELNGVEDIYIRTAATDTDLSTVKNALRIDRLQECRFTANEQSASTDGSWSFDGLRSGWTFKIRNHYTSGTPSCLSLDFPSHSGPISYWINMSDSGASRCHILGDGDIKNVDNSYGAISDERIKQDITDANSQWDDIKGLRVRNFKRKDEVREKGESAKTHIGLIAQETEAVSPNLVDENPADKFDIRSSSEFGTLWTAGDSETQDAVLYIAEDPEVMSGQKNIGDIKTPATAEIGDVKTQGAEVKSMKYSVLYMKAIKCLQEAQTRIETLESKVAVLEG